MLGRTAGDGIGDGGGRGLGVDRLEHPSKHTQTQQMKNKTRSFNETGHDSIVKPSVFYWLDGGAGHTGAGFGFDLFWLVMLLLKSSQLGSSSRL